MSVLTGRQARLLAGLLEADGAVVSYARLGDAIGSAGVNDNRVVRQYVERLRRLGLNCIEVVPGRGCRLTSLPPDWTLDSVLAVLDAMRRDGLLVRAAMTWRKTA